MDRMPRSVNRQTQMISKTFMLMYLGSQNVNVILQKVLTPFNWYVFFGKITKDLAQDNSLDICVLRPLSKCSVLSIFSIGKFCYIQVFLSIMQFKIWQKYLQTNRTMMNRSRNYGQKLCSETYYFSSFIG